MLHSSQVLVITVDPDLLTLAKEVLESEGHKITCVPQPQQALNRLHEGGLYDFIVFDTSRQPPDSLYLLETLLKAAGTAHLCLLVPFGISLWKLDAERLGIRNTLLKPLRRHDLEQLLNMMDSRTNGICDHVAIKSSGIFNESPYFLEELQNGRYFLAGCEATKKIYNTLRVLAPVDVPVLILGESGVGKDVFANLLHTHSLRSRESYLSVNCAALPSDLLESELFGYEAGAFTGALKTKLGKFELANKGTILLDEIGEMSAPMQAKLLHVLQDGQFSKLGARTTTQVNVRIAAATNINIEHAMAQHTFREDLFYRISAFTITIPSLRERTEEIPFFVEEMMRRQSVLLRQQPVYVSHQLMAALQEYQWPGNLRELSNFVIRMLILQDPKTALADMEFKIRSKRNSSMIRPATDTSATQEAEGMQDIVRNFKEQTESRLIQEALEASGWNRRHAALQLRISYRGMLYKIQQYNLKETGRSLQCRPR